MPMSTRRQFLQAAGFSALAVRAAAQQPRVRTIAGTGAPGYSASITDALQTPSPIPTASSRGPTGRSIFVVQDTGRVRRLDLRNRTITTLAGTGEKGYSGDGGPAAAATLSAPHELRFNRAGHLFVVERDNHVVRRIDARSRVISTVAGTGIAGFSGDGGPAVKAQFRQPHSIAFDGMGRLLVCDIGNSRVRRIDLQTGIITTFAGTGERGDAR